MVRMCDCEEQSMSNPSRPVGRRVYRGLYLGTNSRDNQWIRLPAPLPASVAEELEQEDKQRFRFGLPPRDFHESAVRSGQEWDREGALRAVLTESERLAKRERDDVDDNVSVGFARGYGFFFGVKHNAWDVIEQRMASARPPKRRARDSSGCDFYCEMNDCIGESGARDEERAALNDRALRAVVRREEHGIEVGQAVRGRRERRQTNLGDECSTAQQTVRVQDEPMDGNNEILGVPRDSAAKRTCARRIEVDDTPALLPPSSLPSRQRPASPPPPLLSPPAPPFSPRVPPPVTSQQAPSPPSTTRHCTTADASARNTTEPQRVASSTQSAENFAGAATGDNPTGNTESNGGLVETVSSNAGMEGDATNDAEMDALSDEEALDVDDEDDIAADEEEDVFEDMDVRDDVGESIRRSRVEKLYKALHMTLVSLRKCVSTLNDTTETPLFHKRVVCCRVATSYQGANVNAPLRTVAIYLNIAEPLGLCRGRVACVRFMVSRSPNGDALPPIDSEIATACSCSPLVDAARCEHVKLIADSAALRSELKYILGINSTRTMSPTPAKWRAICVGERKRTIKAAWIVVRHNATSARMLNFVPVLESAAAKRAGQPIEKRVACQRCRLKTMQRGLCDHESTVVSTVESILNDSSTNNGDEPQRTSSSNRYVSTLPRRVFPCASDNLSLRQINNRLQNVQALRCKNNRVDKNGNVTPGMSPLEIDVHVVDNLRSCWKCGEVLCTLTGSENCNLEARTVMLHTLLYGSTWICVYDMRCWKCATLTYFDGRGSGLFMSAMRCCYSREILDYLMFRICMLGGTFREGYESMKALANSPSARHVRWGGYPLSCARRTTSDAFSMFLRIVEYPRNETLRKVFRCSTCEPIDANGNRKTEGLVMDGTATGILGRLPLFKRPSHHILGASNTAPQQYVIRNRDVRKYIASFFKAAKKSGEKVNFSVSLPPKYIAAKVEYAFFDELADELLQGTQMTSIIELMFDAVDFREGLIFLMQGRQSQENVIVSHKLTRISLRTTFYNVYHCFLLESIAVAMISSNRHEAAVIEVCVALERFSQCGHYDAIPHGNEQSVCIPCAVKLGKVGEKLFDSLPQLSNFIQMLTESIFEGDLQPYRKLVVFVVMLLNRSLQVLANFKVRYEERKTTGASEYCEQFKEPKTSDVINNWKPSDASDNESDSEAAHNSSLAPPDDRRKTISTCEAAVTGELFPGRPLLRPRVAFQNKEEDLGGDACVKEYTYSNRHSPGLFTVQCACEKPKLLGLIVMKEAESLSIALNTIITRFDPLPNTVYYDNACNLSKSTGLRFPWVFESTKFLCDRFHYLSHTCSGAFDPDSFKKLDPSKTSSAEAINRMWKMSRTHVRFLNGLNLVPFLYCRALFINMRAHLKERGTRKDVEDKDVYALADEMMPCDCHRCALSDSSN